MRTLQKLKVALLSTTVAQLALISATSAQDVMVEEIVVTALRREEKLQDVPAAISALSADDLRAMGAGNYQTYLNTVPGVFFADSGRRSRINIRGVAEGFSDPPLSSTTGVYIDEAPVTEQESFTFDPSLYDVERVEVLRGPQGTLYGSSSMGGTVRVILNKPRLSATEAVVEGSLGAVSHGGTNTKIDGVLNLPVVEDRVALRVSAGHQRSGGFIDNVAVGATDENINTRDRTSGRAALLLQPADNANIVISALFQRDEWDASPYSDRNLGGYDVARYFSEDGASEAQLYGVNATFDFDWMSLLSATNYLDKRSHERVDAATFGSLIRALTGIPVLPNQGVGAAGYIPYDVFTQEIRLSSQGAETIEWILGGFYSTSNSRFDQYFPTDGVPALQAAYGTFGLYRAIADTQRRQFAGFGEVTYNVTPRFSVTAGARVADLTQKFQREATGVLNGGTTSSKLSAASTPLTMKFLANFQATPENLLYIQAAEGFRDGAGVSPAPFNVCGPDLRSIGLTSSPTQYNPDKLWSYEAGSKNTFLDNRMTFNAAAYYIDWRQRQQSLTLPTCRFSVILNAGNAASKGLEFETSLRPTENLTVHASLGYSDAKLKTFPIAGLAFSNNRLALSPKWQWAVNAQYEDDITADLSGFARADVSYVGSRWNILQGLGANATLLDGYTIANARIGVAAETWDVALYTTNLFDKRVVVNSVLGTNGYDILGEPRVIGVNAKVRY